MPTPRSILWFRRDLRLHDNPALNHAGRDRREVVPVFVIDPALVAASGAPRLAFMYRSLRALDRALDGALGGKLVVRYGDPRVEVPRLAAEANADDVVVARDCAPYGRRRDEAVATELRSIGVSLTERGSPYAVAPGSVVKDDGSPYAVFTPFCRAWRAIGHRPPVEHDDVKVSTAGLATEQIPEDPDVGCRLPEAGEAAALETWKRFVANGLDDYPALRDVPGKPGTSRMSPYLRWGHVHPRQLLADLGDSPGHEVFRKELAWREFYADVLFHHPQSARQNLSSTMDAIEVDTDADARRRFQLWVEGRTGFPIVDAGMRQLLATGWMHNRVRMITASFLVKDLHLPWQWGARHFMRHLVDGDLASNQHGWQWTAGTGTDAAPYFRVFNPTSQAARFDPDGTYVRRWVPEADRDIAPMVDHGRERAESLRRFRAAIGR